MSAIADMLKMQLEMIRDEGKIFCPYCKAEYDYSEDGDVISYWGEGDEVEVTCQNDECEREFKVKEYVRRTFETRRLT